jgi:glycosyltransferase involved in cell wall biosynthesis
MVLGMPWDRRLGAPRVQIELAEQFSMAGHRVDKLSLEDVFAAEPRSRLEALTRADFGRAARARLEAIAPAYDIIDAQHGDVPFSKQELGFDGLLVARSCGLYGLYREAERRMARKWGARATGHPLLRPYRSYRRRRRWADQRRSLENADLINVLSVDEERWVDEHLGLGHKTVPLPNGARAAYLEALSRAEGAPDRDTPRIAFLGSWTPRKGILDLPAFIAGLRETFPALRVSLLGTGRAQDVVARDLGPLAGAVDLRVVPEFSPDELPALLRGSAAAVLPSYVEGFCLAVLELAAAGVPTVGYDVPGPRIVMGQVDPGLLAPEGDVRGLVTRVESVIRLSEPAHAALRRRCIQVAARYAWERIAAEHLEIYADALERLRAARRARTIAYPGVSSRSHRT